MKSKISLICVLIFLFLLFFSQCSFAKYVIVNTSNLEVYIDKTPPTIVLKSTNINETYSKTDLSNLIQDSSDITVTTSDNVKIAYNEYYYNSTAKDFTNIEAIKFDPGKTFSEDGYYKIVAVDTSGNKTEIIVLVDKTVPDVQVKYFKKGEEKTSISQTEIIKVAGVRTYKTTENIIDTESEDETKVENNEIAVLATGTLVYNESDFQEAIKNKVSEISTVGSINFSKPIYINYPVVISPVSIDNALRYSSTDSFIVIENRRQINSRCNGN